MLKEAEYNDLFEKRLRAKRMMAPAPAKIFFEITYKCNLSCRYCYIRKGTGRRELTTKMVTSLFDQIVRMGGDHLILTGGEPLMRKDIFPLMRYARKAGMLTHLFTNGTLITPKVADRLKELELLSVEVSVRSLKKERFEKITRVRGSFDRMMSGVRLLRERGVSLVFKFDINKLNMDEIENFKEFSRRMGAKSQLAIYMSPCYDGTRGNLSLRLDPGEMKRALSELRGSAEKRNRRKKGIAGSRSPAPPGGKAGPADTEEREKRYFPDGPDRNKLFWCHAAKGTMAIDPFGDIRPCVAFPLPGYSSVKDGISGSLKKMRREVDSYVPNPGHKCYDCALRSACFSCPAKALLECNDMNCCPDYFKKIAVFNKKLIDSGRGR